MSIHTGPFARPSRRKERRGFARFQLPLSRVVEARWNGRVLPLRHEPQQEDISATGLRLCLANDAAPPVGAQLDIRFPLVERPSMPGPAYAHCRGRVLRHTAANSVAVFLEEVGYMFGEPGSPLAGQALIRT